MGLWGFGRWQAGGDPLPGTKALASGKSIDSVLLAESFVELGLQIVSEVRGPMRLWEFSHRLGLRLGMPPVPLTDLSDAVKATLSQIDDPRLKVLAPGMPGVGYVYDAADPESRPLRCSR
jgi:hypothetical protein